MIVISVGYTGLRNATNNQPQQGAGSLVTLESFWKPLGVRYLELSLSWNERADYQHVTPDLGTCIYKWTTSASFNNTPIITNIDIYSSHLTILQVINQKTFSFNALPHKPFTATYTKLQTPFKILIKDLLSKHSQSRATYHDCKNVFRFFFKKQGRGVLPTSSTSHVLRRQRPLQPQIHCQEATSSWRSSQ